jgi:hypothetical protein
MLNRPRRTLPAVLAPLTMIVSCLLVAGCGNDKLSDDAYGFIDLAPWYYDGSSAANPSAGLPREIPPTRGWVNGVRAEYYDFGLVGVTKKRSDGKLPDYASIPPMYFFFDSGGNPLFSKPVYEIRTGLWHMRGGKGALDPNPCTKAQQCYQDENGNYADAPKNVPYAVRVRNVMGDFQRPVVDRLQHNADYSGLWEIWAVTVQDDYEPDAIKNYATLKKGIDQGKLSVERTKAVINCPVLDDRTYVTPTPLWYGVPHPRIELWYRTKMGSCFLADGWQALGDDSGRLYKADSKSRLNVMDVVTYTVGSGEGARTAITAPVSKMFIPTASVATLDSRGTVDVRYTNDNVTEVLPRTSQADPPGYRPIRWLWDLKVPQDPPYVPSTYRSTSDMDPSQMVNRLGSNVPFTKNFPLIGVNISCDPKTGLLADGTGCGDLQKHAPGVPLVCYGTSYANTAGTFVSDPGGARCDVPLVRFAEFCAPGIAACGSFNPKATDRDLTPDESAAKTLNSNVIGGYTCHPNGPQGGYCFYRCDADGSAGSKDAMKVEIRYKGPDDQIKVDKGPDGTGIELGYDQRCGNIPGYKCLNPTGVTATQGRVCLRGCDSGKPDAFNDEFCKIKTNVMINEKVNGDFQKGMTCSTRGINGAAGCQWDPAFEPRDPGLNFIPPK